MVVAIIVGIAIVLDVITGLLKAVSEHNISSTKLRVGLLHKATEVITVFGMWALQYFLVQTDIVHIDIPLYPITSTYVCIMEIISVIENLCIVNPQLYNLFKPYLENLIKKGSDINDNGE